MLTTCYFQDADGKPKTIDPTVFNKQPMPEEEFDLGDDTITKDQLSRSAPEKRVMIHLWHFINFS